MWKSTPAPSTTMTPLAALPLESIRPALEPIQISHIPAGFVIQGEIEGCEALFLEGRIEGTICIPEHTVTIGENGEAQGDIVAREILVLGKTSGTLNATHRVEVRAAGHTEGEIATGHLNVEDGALIEGVVHVFGAETHFPKMKKRPGDPRAARPAMAGHALLCIRPLA